MVMYMLTMRFRQTSDSDKFSHQSGAVRAGIPRVPDVVPGRFLRAGETERCRNTAPRCPASWGSWLVSRSSELSRNHTQNAGPEGPE
jgi:hypothetical protein